MKYIVCQDDMDTGTCVEAIDEFDAVTQFQKEMGLGDVICDVYSAGLCRPRIDIIEVLNDWGENNPEYSPLNEPWSTYIGSDSLDALQKGLNKLIEEHVQPWYASDQLVLRYRPPAGANGMKYRVVALRSRTCCKAWGIPERYNDTVVFGLLHLEFAMQTRADMRKQRVIARRKGKPVDIGPVFRKVWIEEVPI